MMFLFPAIVPGWAASRSSASSPPPPPSYATTDLLLRSQADKDEGDNETTLRLRAHADKGA